MTQLLESLGDLNLNLMGGFSVVTACSDNWRQSMRTNLNGHDDRLSKLENTLSTMRSSMRTVQSINSEIGMEQKRISSVVDQQESLVSDFNQEALVSGRRARTMITSVEKRIGELGERMNELRDANMNSSIPPSVIHSLNNTIIDGAPSTAVEFLSQQIDELTQVIYTKKVISADLRIEFSKLQETVNSSILLQGVSLICPIVTP